VASRKLRENPRQKEVSKRRLRRVKSMLFHPFQENRCPLNHCHPENHIDSSGPWCSQWGYVFLLTTTIMRNLKI